MNERLDQQIKFLIEIDKLKNILRQTYVMDKSRQENTAEHSWHIAMMAAVLSEHASQKVDLIKVIKILLVHDLVEIDAGDTFAYDDRGKMSQIERENKAADRIFSLLPDDQAKEFRALWDEYESGNSEDAQFARAMDRFHPIIQNYKTDGIAWKKHEVKSNQVLERNAKWKAIAPSLWEYARNLIDDSVKKGFLKSN